MLRDYYKQMSDVLKGIKKEGNIENIEIEELNEENGYEEVEINYPQNKKFKSSMLKKGIIATAAAICLSTGLSSVPTIQEDTSVVEAATKKDKKKPVIKFSGKSKMTVEKNKSVKIPKTTAKDNKDGNVTKKIKVTVKKGNKSYSKIAKAIKSNKSVKFTSTGKYVITYTVTDKAGNKATKKRYVTVVNEEKANYNLTTEEKTTEATTQEQTTEVTTETPTTEAPTTESPTTEEPTMPTDYSKYEINEVTIGNVKYKTTRDRNFFSVISSKTNLQDEKINIEIENDYREFKLDPTDIDYYKDCSVLLKLMGSIKVTDSYGNDITDNIVIYDYALSETENKNYVMYIYAEDSKGKSSIKRIVVTYLPGLKTSYSEEGGILLSTDPVVCGYIRNNTVSLNNENKILKKVIF